MATVQRDRKDIGLVTVLRPIMATPASGRHPRAWRRFWGGGLSDFRNGHFHTIGSLTAQRVLGYAGALTLMLEELAQELLVLERVDISAFQRRARVLQSLWREEQGYEVGVHKGPSGCRPLGSRLPMPWARETLSNYLTPTIRDVVRAEVMDPKRSRGKLYGKPRIFNDLLSSQPMAFNLFGELQQDLELCGHLLAYLTNGRFSAVERIDFEFSPGRSDPQYTGDRSAFDVFLTCRTSDDSPAFVGIEVKYHENLKDKASKHRVRYDELADAMGCFATESRPKLRENPFQQIWRDHLLAGALLLADQYADGLFVFLYPKDNVDCSSAIEAYRECLTDKKTIAAWTLEEVTRTLSAHSDAAWIRLFRSRYLTFERVTSRLTASCG